MWVLELSTILALTFVAVMARDSPNAKLIGQMRQLPEYAPKSEFSKNVYEDAKLDAPSLIQKYGYPCEIHKVITSDGYILEMHRIPHGRDKNNAHDPKKIPVILVHGLTMSSADWVINRPDLSLGYRLAEEGYDVWMANARGNYYSRAHLSLNPDEKSSHFWNFSWEQIGVIDVAASIDRILNVTKHSKIHYVGHSQGCTSILVLGSIKPEYNEKIISFQGLAPASFFIYNDFRLMKIFGRITYLLEKIRLTRREIFGRSKKIRWIGTNICSDDAKLQPLCLSVPYIGKFLGSFNTTMIPAFLGHFPAGSSLKQFAHYGQSVNDGTFSRFSLGVIGNLVHYGTMWSPNYDLSKVSVPTYLHYGPGDKIVDPRDVLHLATTLPNVKTIIKVARSNFGHFDFLWAPDIPLLVNDNVVRMLKEAEAEMKLGNFNNTTVTSSLT